MQDIKVVFFPHAGGSASYYRSYAEAINEMGYQAVTVEYPGHGMRLGDNLIDNMDRLVDSLYDSMFSSTDSCDYVFLGHSMGSWVAYEMCKKFRSMGRKAPLFMIASGNVSPVLRKGTLKYRQMPDDEFISDVMAIGGTSQEIFNNEELKELFLPILRNDYILLEDYTSSEEVPEEKVNCDIIAIGGKQDKYVGRKLDSWEAYTKKDFQAYYFSGPHFFLFDHTEKITEMMAEQILQHLVG